MAGLVAATVGITAVAVHIHEPSDAQFTDWSAATMPDLSPRLPTFDSYPYALTPTPPAWTPTTSPPTTPPAPVPVGGVLPPDGSVIMPGDSGEQMELTLVRIANPAPPVDPQNPTGPELNPRPGHRLISVMVQVKNTGAVPFRNDIEQHTWLVDKAGTTYARNVDMTDARQLHPPSQLDPEWWIVREMVFEVPGTAELTRFRLSTHPGAAGRTQDWALT